MPYSCAKPLPQKIGSTASRERNENYVCWNVQSIGWFSCTLWKFRMVLLAPEVDSVPSDVCCAQCCGDTRTIGR